MTVNALPYYCAYEFAGKYRPIDVDVQRNVCNQKRLKVHVDKLDFCDKRYFLR